MSFLNIEDSFERQKTVNAYLALKKRLRERNMQDRSDFQDFHHDLEEQYEPVVASNAEMTTKITDELVPIKAELEKLTKLAKPKAKRAGKKRRAPEPDEEQQDPDEEQQPAAVKPDPKPEFGPLAQHFIRQYMDEDMRQKEIDTSFGIRFANDEWKIGDQRVLLNPDDSMLIDDETYPGTPGFWSLVTQKKPMNYTDDDLDRYKELLHETHVLHQDYDKYARYPRANRSKKWSKILAPIWREFTEQGIARDDNDSDGEDGQIKNVKMVDQNEDSDGYETAPETAPEEEEGHGLKMYLQKKGRCYGLSKTCDGGIKLKPRPKLAGVHGSGLFLRQGSDIYRGEGLLLGKSSPFRNIPVLGWLL